MIERLAAIGFECETIASHGVTNLWAVKRGTEGRDGKLLAFAGHTDVVPTGPLEQWTSPALHPRASRRQAVRPRRGRHEDLAGRLRGGQRGDSWRASAAPRLDRDC